VKNSLVKRLLLITLPIALLAGALYAAAIVYIETQSLEKSQQAQIEAQVKQLAEIMAIPTWNLDQEFIQNYLTQYTRNPHVECIELLSDANIQETSPEGCTHPTSGALMHSEPIIYEGNYIGVIVSSSTVKLDNQRLYFILVTRIPVALVALLAIFLVVFGVFKRWVVVPLQEMTESVQAFQREGKLHLVECSSPDEIGALIHSFNRFQQNQLNHDKVLTSEKEKAEQALEDLQRTQSQLVESEKMASLGSLVAGISHEINTPLGVAKTSSSHIEEELKKLTQGFENGTLTKSQMQAFMDQFEDGLHLLIANLNRASELMASFKQVSADQSHDEIRIFNLHEYLEETVYTLKPNLRRYQVSVNLDCPEDVHLESYPGAFSQIITNLIMNSLLHGYTQEEQGSIKVEVKEQADNFIITYKDDGAGMKEEVRKKIFDPFFTTKRGNGGTGLGMHIIYNLVTIKLQGNIEVASELGAGSTFTMTLPKTLSEVSQDAAH
jgi:signal transduction histidine kinase